MLTTNEVFPEDLVIQILLWLPVMSLLRFKCVCKSWYAFISGQNFIAKHLFHNQSASNKNNNVGFLVIRQEKSSDDSAVLSRLSNETLEISSTQVFPPPYNSAIDTKAEPEIVGSINGLVCLHYYNMDVVLWNLATKETKFVSESNLSYPEGRVDMEELGFGYDVKTNDYKVVKLFVIFDPDPELNFYTTKFIYEAEVYCLSTDSWRKVAARPPGKIMSYCHYRTYTNGMFSWWACHNKEYFECILSFDMSNEVFLITEFPDDDDDSLFATFINRITFFVMNELVALSVVIKDRERSESCLHIWSLLEFGVKESWTKLFTIGPLTGIYRPIGFWKNDKLFLENSNKQLILYDPSTQEMTDLQIDFDPKSTGTVTYYVESLVSVRGGNDLEERHSS